VSRQAKTFHIKSETWATHFFGMSWRLVRVLVVSELESDVCNIWCFDDTRRSNPFEFAMGSQHDGGHLSSTTHP
jgi:hypothetical protein